MHHVLKNAIDKPRMPQPYGSDPGDVAFNNHLGGTAMSVDAFIKSMNTRWDKRAANDNYSRRDYRAE